MLNYAHMGTLIQHPEKLWEHFTPEEQKAIRVRNKRIERLQRKVGAYPPDIGWGLLIDLNYMDRSLGLPPHRDNYVTEERIARIEDAYAKLDPKEQRRRASTRAPTYY